tara:strand:- start:3244 stop:3426 length:183 start_codon:yes stop_codon:yes gene_type:complete
MKYIVAHRDQVSSKFETEVFDTLEAASNRQKKLRLEYHDTIVLQNTDINEIYNIGRTVQV